MATSNAPPTLIDLDAESHQAEASNKPALRANDDKCECDAEEIIELKQDGLRDRTTPESGQTSGLSAVYVACSSLAKKNIKSDSRV